MDVDEEELPAEQSSPVEVPWMHLWEDGFDLEGLARRRKPQMNPAKKHGENISWNWGHFWRSRFWRYSRGTKYFSGSIITASEAIFTPQPQKHQKTQV